MTQSPDAQRAGAAVPPLTRALADVAPSFVVALRNDCIIYANPSAIRILGVTGEPALRGLGAETMVAEPDRDTLAALLRDPADYVLGARLNLQRFDGEGLAAVEMRAETVELPDGPATALVARDISDLEHAAAALRTRERRLNTVLDTVLDAIVIVGADGAIERFNRAAEKMFGWSQGQTIGRKVDMLMTDEIARDHQSYVDRLIAQEIGAGAALGHPREQLGRRKDGSTFPIEITLTQMNFDERRTFIAVIRDLTERKMAEERLRYLAHHDTLTGLPNRTLINQIINRRIEAQREGRLGAFVVLGVDLDRFKSINDLFGFSFGDKVLTAIADRLRGMVDADDILARPSGDEFIILFDKQPDEEETERLCSRILDLRARPVEFDGAEASIGMSVAVLRCHPGEDIDADMVLHRLETTVAVAKESGRNAYRRYSDEIGKRKDESAKLEFELRRALDEGGLQLLYQPKVSLSQNRVIGMEALLRWNRVGEDGGANVVSPVQFIPIAEESGLIVRMGAWALEEACRKAKEWAVGRHADLKVAVNLSPQQFRDARLSDKVRGALASTGLEPKNLELEITESGLVDGVDDVVKLMRSLKDVGMTIAIDDFGTGYSSLSYLKRLPIDVLKIDQSFMRGVPADQEDTSIVRAVIGLARTLDLGLVAEGVETADQVSFLHEMACDVAQGYFFAKPLPAEAFGQFLDEF